MQILRVIKKYGWSLEAVAKELGITKGTFSVSINRNPTTQRLIDVANVLGCSPAEFFSDWDTAPENKHPKTAESAPQEAKQEVGTANEIGMTTEELPFYHDEPAAVTQQAIVCPHCGKPMKIEVKG